MPGEIQRAWPLVPTCLLSPIILKPPASLGYTQPGPCEMLAVSSPLEPSPGNSGTPTLAPSIGLQLQGRAGQGEGQFPPTLSPGATPWRRDPECLGPRPHARPDPLSPPRGWLPAFPGAPEAEPELKAQRQDAEVPGSTPRPCPSFSGHPERRGQPPGRPPRKGKERKWWLARRKVQPWRLMRLPSIPTWVSGQSPQPPLSLCGHRD